MDAVAEAARPRMPRRMPDLEPPPRRGYGTRARARDPEPPAGQRGARSRRGPSQPTQASRRRRRARGPRRRCGRRAPRRRPACGRCSSAHACCASVEDALPCSSIAVGAEVAHERLEDEVDDVGRRVVELRLLEDQLAVGDEREELRERLLEVEVVCHLLRRQRRVLEQRRRARRPARGSARRWGRRRSASKTGRQSGNAILPRPRVGPWSNRNASSAASRARRRGLERRGPEQVVAAGTSASARG